MLLWYYYPDSFRGAFVWDWGISVTLQTQY